MNREELLNWFLENPECWGITPNIYDWILQDGQYVHSLHDPITIDDWNRAKIVPNTKIRIWSPEHSEYVQKLAFEAGFKWSLGQTEAIKLPSDEQCIFFNEDIKHGPFLFFDTVSHKEIFIEMPAPNINARVLAEKVGSKHDTGKPLYNLIPVHAEAELVDVLTFGATKYAPNQWRNVPNATGRYTAAAMRHLAAYRMGETHDIESGKHHLAHAMCCLAFIIELDLEQDK